MCLYCAKTDYRVPKLITEASDLALLNIIHVLNSGSTTRLPDPKRSILPDFVEIGWETAEEIAAEPGSVLFLVKSGFKSRISGFHDNPLCIFQREYFSCPLWSMTYPLAKTPSKSDQKWRKNKVTRHEKSMYMMTLNSHLGRLQECNFSAFTLHSLVSHWYHSEDVYLLTGNVLYLTIFLWCKFHKYFHLKHCKDWTELIGVGFLDEVNGSRDPWFPYMFNRNQTI